jgi:hypothetical protein
MGQRNTGLQSIRHNLKSNVFRGREFRRRAISSRFGCGHHDRSPSSAGIAATASSCFSSNRAATAVAARIEDFGCTGWIDPALGFYLIGILLTDADYPEGIPVTWAHREEKRVFSIMLLPRDSFKRLTCILYSTEYACAMAVG